MRRPVFHRDRASFDSTMTPMIDVVFQLLIFFVCTASFAVAEEMLPSQYAAAEGGGAEIVIDPAEADLERIVLRGETVGNETNWSINDRPVGRAADVNVQMKLISARMREVGTPTANLAVTLDVAARVPLGDAIDVYDLCRLAGFEKIQFAAKESRSGQAEE